MTRTLRDLVKELTNDGYLGRARERAQRRRSRWNLVLVPVAVGAIAGTTYVLFLIMWGIHTAIYPSHAGRLAEFWGRSISFGSFVSSFLLLVPLFFASLPIGMILANVVARLIPAARRALDREAEGVPAASFRESTALLWKVAVILIPVCLVLSGIGAATLSDLR